MVLGNVEIYMQMNETGCLPWYARFKNLNLKFLKENIQENLQDTGFGKDFLNDTKRAGK